MAKSIQRITPFFWFNDQAEEAAGLYTSIFPNSHIQSINRYTEEGAKISGRPVGSAMTVAFQLDGQEFVGLNGGPHYRFTEAISLAVNCESQEEIDRYWDRLGEGGDPNAQQCGWLKDRYGVSWQIVPAILPALMSDPAKAQRVSQAFMQMKKLDLDTLLRA